MAKTRIPLEVEADENAVVFSIEDPAYNLKRNSIQAYQETRRTAEERRGNLPGLPVINMSIYQNVLGRTA